MSYVSWYGLIKVAAPSLQRVQLYSTLSLIKTAHLCNCMFVIIIVCDVVCIENKPFQTIPTSPQSVYVHGDTHTHTAVVQLVHTLLYCIIVREGLVSLWSGTAAATGGGAS